MRNRGRAAAPEPACQAVERSKRPLRRGALCGRAYLLCRPFDRRTRVSSRAIWGCAAACCRFRLRLDCGQRSGACRAYVSACGRWRTVRDLCRPSPRPSPRERRGEGETVRFIAVGQEKRSSPSPRGASSASRGEGRGEGQRRAATRATASLCRQGGPVPAGLRPHTLCRLAYGAAAHPGLLHCAQSHHWERASTLVRARGGQPAGAPHRYGSSKRLRAPSQFYSINTPHCSARCARPSKTEAAKVWGM